MLTCPREISALIFLKLISFYMYRSTDAVLFSCFLHNEMIFLPETVQTVFFGRFIPSQQILPLWLHTGAGSLNGQSGGFESGSTSLNTLDYFLLIPVCLLNFDIIRDARNLFAQVLCYPGPLTRRLHR